MEIQAVKSFKQSIALENQIQYYMLEMIVHTCKCNAIETDKGGKKVQWINHYSQRHLVLQNIYILLMSNAIPTSLYMCIIYTFLFR